MKKFLKLFLIFTLVFTITFNYVKADPEDPGTDEPVLIASAPAVSIKGNNNTLILSWEAVENATSYVISRSTNAKKGFKNVKTVTGTTYTDTKLSYGTTYYYKVTAKGPNNTKVSAVVNKKVSPNKVVISSLKPGSKQVKITWGKTSNSGYYVFRSTDGKKWTKVATIKKNKTTNYTDKKLKSNKKYYYQVQAYQKVGRKTYTGSKSAVMTVVTSPAAPSVKARSEDIEDISLTITKVSGAVKYQIYHSTKKDGTYTLYDEVDSSYFNGKTTYKYWYYPELPYKRHYFKIRACSNDSCGSFTAVNAQGELEKTVIISAKGSKKNVALEWDYVWGAEGYEIYRATSKNGKYSKIKTITSGTSYIDKSIKSNKTYYYKIRSYMSTPDKKKHYSAYSSIRKVTTGSSAGVDSAMEDAKVISKQYYPSKARLIAGLVEYYGYTQSDAKKGVEKAKINFKDNAVKTAKDIVNWYGAVSETQVKNELLNAGFTESEANYALTKVNVNWRESLKANIQYDLYYGISKAGIFMYYANESTGLTDEQVQSVIDELNIDFYDQASRAVDSYINNNYNGEQYSYARTVKYLTDNWFTAAEIEYAMENCDIDWIAQAVNAYRDIEDNYYSRAEVEELLTNDEYMFTLEELDLAFIRISVNFNEVALLRAEYYVYGNSAYHYSVAKLTEMLQEDGFTEENIAYVFEELDYDFDESCLEQAREFLGHDTYYSEATITSMLQGLGFTSENISYALEELNIDFNEMALNAGRSYMFNNTYEDSTREQVRNSLRAGGFTEEQVVYAITNMGAQRWNESALKTTASYIEHINQTENRGLSKLRAVEILPGLEYTTSEINYVKDNLGSTDDAYFGEQALKSARYHLRTSIQSESSLVDLLTESDLYAPNEANYAIIHGMLDFDTECVERIEETYYVENLNKTLDQVRSELKSVYGFEDGNIDYAFAHTNISDYVLSE